MPHWSPERPIDLLDDQGTVAASGGIEPRSGLEIRPDLYPQPWRERVLLFGRIVSKVGHSMTTTREGM